ncbi:MAG: hypothetical protein ACR2ME_00335 [Acidimicrobiia bacterium]
MEHSIQENRSLSRTASPGRAIKVGLIAGVVASLAMGVFAMMASATYQGTGLFTPLYHIGSAFGSESAANAMGASMEEAGTGEAFYFAAGPAALGMAIHVMVGAVWGLIFGLLVHVMRISRVGVIVAGVLFGLLVMLVMSFLVLPAVASMFGSGPPIAEMASMVGWGTFALEHAIFGLVVGWGSKSLARRSGEADSRAAH